MAKKVVLQVVDPRSVYSLPAFLAATRLGQTTLHAAKRAGLPLPRFTIGRCAFVEGAAGIAWLKELADMEARKAAAAQDEMRV